MPYCVDLSLFATFCFYATCQMSTNIIYTTKSCTHAHTRLMSNKTCYFQSKQNLLRTYLQVWPSAPISVDSPPSASSSNATFLFSAIASAGDLARNNRPLPYYLNGMKFAPCTAPATWLHHDNDKILITAAAASSTTCYSYKIKH